MNGLPVGWKNYKSSGTTVTFHTGNLLLLFGKSGSIGILFASQNKIATPLQTIHAISTYCEYLCSVFATEESRSQHRDNQDTFNPQNYPHSTYITSKIHGHLVFQRQALLHLKDLSIHHTTFMVTTQMWIRLFKLKNIH